MEDEEAQAVEEADAGVSQQVALELNGLEPLGDDFVYEGWVIVDETPYSTGRFSIEADGSRTYHTGSDVDLSNGSAFVLTIEPAEGDDPAPGDSHVLAGDLVDGVADLTVGHPAALGNDFTGASGQFVLATPTTDTLDDELAGIWFIDIVDGSSVIGLDLPVLPVGWEYEGWVVIDGQPVSTGRFLDAGGADDFNLYSGTDGTGPNFPGEDFIINPPQGLEFPVDLPGSTVVISIEPEIDNSPDPFAFKPLSAVVPDGIGDHVDILLELDPALPTGTATLN